jgi:hypothetical protein
MPPESKEPGAPYPALTKEEKKRSLLLQLKYTTPANELLDVNLTITL